MDFKGVEIILIDVISGTSLIWRRIVTPTVARMFSILYSDDWFECFDYAPV